MVLGQLHLPVILRTYFLDMYRLYPLILRHSKMFFPKYFLVVPLNDFSITLIRTSHLGHHCLPYFSVPAILMIYVNFQQTVVYNMKCCSPLYSRNYYWVVCGIYKLWNASYLIVIPRCVYDETLDIPRTVALYGRRSVSCALYCPGRGFQLTRTTRREAYTLPLIHPCISVGYFLSLPQRYFVLLPTHPMLLSPFYPTWSRIEEKL